MLIEQEKIFKKKDKNNNLSSRRKKNKKVIRNRIANAKFESELKRREKKSKQLKKDNNNVIRSDVQYSSLCSQVRTSFVTFMNQRLNYVKVESPTIQSPKKLSFVKNYDESMLFFEEL